MKNLFIDDFLNSVKKISLPYELGKQDINLRYKRSVLGPFWITINIVLMSICLSFVFGFIMKQNLNQLFPHLFFGLIFWNFITLTINDGCAVFSANSHMLHQIKIPYLVLVFRVIIRNIYILMHNVITIPIIIILFKVDINANIFFLLINFPLVLLILFFTCIFLGILNSRFRDLENIVQNLLNISFYLTPIFWNLDLLSGSKYGFMINLNPFYHMIELLRKPLLGLQVNSVIYLFIFCLILLTCFLASFFFIKYKKRIAYWV